ncbi:hypothetical protein EXIGLDRAFT_103510 [Exidia glandulosa HHB12029]|uniref:F-box domain-containing protein n=1 Tax=Exidia glandulosa HHB12029 TaxID=1314781 RepID=A0A165GX64_EXIGL|nr:hypothetical protein EXIGLDRAFT_103510 [Exidia glandulosa HHB12029]
MRMTIDGALADVAHAWNERHMDPLRRLPAELHVSCLQWLEVHELFTASHVSRHWRAIAVSEPTLWDSYDTGPFKDVEQSLKAVLHRSRSVPFDFTWSSYYTYTSEMSPMLGDMLLEHAFRLRRVRLRESTVPAAFLLSLLTSATPQLCTLEAWTREPLQLPDSMSSHTLPRLTSLMLERTILPTCIQAVSSVISLHLQVLPDCRHVFLLFPCVQDVTLDGVMSTTILPHELPQSLTSIEVFSDHLGREDHSEQLLSSGWRLVPHMRVDSTSILRPLQWFTARTNDRWRMTMTMLVPAGRNSVEMTLLAEEDAALHVFMPYDAFLIETGLEYQGCWTGYITRLTIDGVLDSLPKLVVRIQMLPSLLSLTLRLTQAYDVAAQQLISRNVTISVPVMQDLVLDYASSAKLTAEEMVQFAETVPAFLSWGNRRPLHLVGPGIGRIAQLPRNDLSFASTVCETLRFKDGSFEEFRSFSSPA